MDSSHSTFRQINGPYWTLATEWQFYMILPLLCIGIALLVKWVPPRKRLFAAILCLLGIIVWGLAVRYWGLYYLNHPWKSFLWFPPQVVSDLKFFFFGMTGKYTEDFAVGMLISLLYIYAQHPSTSPSFTVRWQRSTIWLWRLGVVILVFSVMWHFKSAYPGGWPFLNGIMPVFNWLSEMLLAIGFGLCIAAILFGNETLQRPFAWRPLRWVGLISYSLYIWHLPLLTLFNTRVLPLLHVQNVYKIYSLYWLWVLLVIFPFALLFFTLVEKPFMRIGDRCRKVIERRYGAKREAPEASPTPPQPEPQKVASYR
jgi:peptidoglycan/LPS O-acetylase OafA/YrhL